MIKTEHQDRESAILIGVVRSGQNRWQSNDTLDELAMLAQTAGAEVVERVIQERHHVDKTFFIGRGKVKQIAEMVTDLHVDMLIFDDDLSPAQAKNVEEVCGVKVIDRSGLILDIFAKHAQTREARTQVELAQLKYLLPRLTRQWKHLERQVGGIGVRGPGEMQLETDRRLIRNRIAVLERELLRIAKQRKTQRKNRQNAFRVALVGYTNVGKSTLLNALTDAHVLVEDQLFATLDATVRAIENSDKRDILLIDTVGFIRKLPHHLVASFRSTLEETLEADLLLHIIDLAHPQFEEQIAAVNTVLKELQAAEKPILHVFNKIDLIEKTGLIERMREKYTPSVFVSAQRGIFMQELRQRLLQYAEQTAEEIDLTVPLTRSDIIGRLYQSAQILQVDYVDDQAHIKARVAPNNANKVRRLVQAAAKEKEPSGIIKSSGSPSPTTTGKDRE
ncbi:MAG TPA: GTPase HflX [bacterium]|nr:GTPase HflX [bacterium]HPG45217.1 GTPase HflX [bacterium]HPM97459.1 GTPase HflX [bacterium]